MIAREGANRVTFRFAPALPDVAALRPGAEVEGRFVIAVNDVEGVVAGEFRVVRDPFGARVEFQPRQAWQPPILRGAPWVAGYRYRARIDLDHAGPMLRAGWERVAAE